MKIINYLLIGCISLMAISCSKITEPVKKIGLGSRIINYQAEEDKVDSLIIPPDLTKPSSQDIFNEIEKVGVEEKIGTETKNVEVMRDNYQRWLLVDMPANKVWSRSKEFFRLYGFKIKSENQKIGIFETDYLEIETKVPDKSLGLIRAALAKALKTQYGLPIADKYRVRIDPLDENSSEVYLTLTSIGEVMNGQSRVWQIREKDIELETEMLLTLMVFLGADKSEAINNIQNNNQIENLSVEVVKSEKGYATLVFPFNKNQTWRYLGWALDELEVDIEDRDSTEGSYFIKVAPERGYFSKLINTIGSIKSYQLYVKQIDNLRSEVYFVDLSQENKIDTIDYSFEFFNEISNKF